MLRLLAGDAVVAEREEADFMLVDRKWLCAGWVLALACAATLSALNLWWGDLNQDEGWYLYAARLTAQGRLPYRDYAFTQGPVLPLVYSLFASGLREYGVAAGRAVTTLFGWLAAVLSALLAGRIARRGARGAAALMAFALIACNVYQSYFTTVVKTYALTSVWFMAGVLCLAFVTGRAGGVAAALAGFFLGVAAGTRLSAGVALPVASLYLLIHARRTGAWRWVAFGLGGLAGLLVWAAPFARLAPDGLRFALLEYHAGRAAGGSLLGAIIYKAGFVSRMVQAYFVGAVFVVGLVALRVFRVEGNELLEGESAPPRFGALLWCTGGAITLTHLAAPFPYEDYQVFMWPAAAVAISVSVMNRVAVTALRQSVRARHWGTWLMMVTLLVNIAAAFSSPINQAWFVRGRDRIWWPLKEQSPIRQLREVAAGIAELAWLADELLTQDVYLAVEANMNVPPGMELGPFCYFPEMERTRAEKLHVLNREMMREILMSSRAPVAAFSGYGLAIRCPEVEPLAEEEQKELRELLARRYQLYCEVPHFGQGHTTLEIYVRRNSKP